MMTTNLCKPPEPLRLTRNNSRNWCDFKEQLQWFLAGTESTEKLDAAKIGIMLSHTGKEAQELYKTLPWAAEGDDKKFDKVLEAFERFCSPQKNILYKRHGFWSMRQDDGESVDSYLTRLKLKVDYCEYDKMGWPLAVRNEMTRDKFVFSLIDDRLKERLLCETELTLERAVALAQRSEASKVQAKAMSSSSNVMLTCDDIQQKKDPPRVFPCGQCGRRHKPKSCPAYGQQCSACHKLHHFAKMCRNKTSVPKSTTQSKKRILAVTDYSSQIHSDASSESESSLLIDPLSIDGLTQHSAWLSTVTTTNGNIMCKLDTGAEASILPISAYNKLLIKPSLKPTDIKLSAYGGSSITRRDLCSLVQWQRQTTQCEVLCCNC